MGAETPPAVSTRARFGPIRTACAQIDGVVARRDARAGVHQAAIAGNSGWTACGHRSTGADGVRLRSAAWVGCIDAGVRAGA